MHFGAIKQMDFLNKDELVLATSGGLILLDFPSLELHKDAHGRKMYCIADTERFHLFWYAHRFTAAQT